MFYLFILIYLEIYLFISKGRALRIRLQCKSRRRPRFDPWVGKIPWRKAWQPTPVFLPGEPHEQRSLVGYSPWSRKESDTTEATWHARGYSKGRMAERHRVELYLLIT